MQVLKEDVKNSIRQAALSEFKRHGYLNASMRQIADSAGITPGNIYRYFKSKEDLFYELVHSTYEKFSFYMLEIKQNIESTISKDAPENLRCLRMIDETIVRLFRDSSAELTILLNKSTGSSYERMKQELITLVIQILEQVFVTMKNNAAPLDVNERNTVRMLAATVIEGVSIILRDHEDGDTIKLLVDELQHLYFVGITEKIKIKCQQ